MDVKKRNTYGYVNNTKVEQAFLNSTQFFLWAKNGANKDPVKHAMH